MASPPDVFAAGDQMLADRAQAIVAEARARLAPTMAAFEALETEYARVTPLAADFVRWRRECARPWVRAVPGLENECSQLDTWLAGSRLLEEFPRHVADARALYAGLTVERLRRGDEEGIVRRLGYAESIGAVENYHRCAEAMVQTIERALARRITAGTLQGVGPAVVSDGVTSPGGRPRRAQGSLSGGDDDE